MGDIFIAVVVMTLLSALAALVTSRYAYSDKGQSTILCITLSVFAAVYFLFYAAGQLYLARLVPSPASIIYTNIASIFAGLAAGWAWRIPQTPPWRRGLMSGMLSCLAIAAIVWLYFRWQSGLHQLVLKFGTRALPCKHHGRHAAPQLQQHFFTPKESKSTKRI